MLKLILNPDGSAKALTFDESCILIGNSDQAHFKIDDPLIHEIHLKILTETDRYLLINAANDPFVSLNGLPFGKKVLKNGDLIQLRNYTIQFEALKESQNPKAENELISWEDIDRSFNIETLLEQVDKFETKEKEEPKKIDPPSLPKEKISTKKLDKCEPIVNSWNKKKTKKTNPIPNWKNLAKLFVGMVVFGVVACSAIYLKARGDNSQEEKKIAAGIADIAMALTYAQVNHISPNNQNLLDPDFIRSNLGCVLSPHLHTQAKIDGEGHFSDSTYILRAYTNNNMTRFLVIAQPLPHFFQWISSKKTFVIDSSSMEIRKISDLKSLNRLLASSAPLEAKNGAEIARIVQQGQLISLPDLSGNKNNWGFVPPRSLAWLHPKAENYIYNAPRYYPFGEAILRDVISHFRNEGGYDDTVKLREQISEFAHLKDPILYTSQGLEAALEAEKALAAIHPDHSFVIGYLQFNPSGYVAQSHLLVNEKRPEVSFEQELSDPIESLAIERNDVTQHPLALRLRAIAASRQKTLRLLGAKITSLIEQQNEKNIPDFYETIEEYLAAYRNQDVSSRTAMVQEISKLYQEYSDMPLQHFMAFVQDAHLTDFVAEVIDCRQTHFPEKTLREETILENITAVDFSRDLLELDERVQKAITILNLEQFPYPSQLVSLQKRLNEVVVEKMVHFLLSPNSPYINQKVSDAERTVLIRILKAAWVTDPHEFDYFVSEFDLLKS